MIIGDAVKLKGLFKFNCIIISMFLFLCGCTKTNNVKETDTISTSSTQIVNSNDNSPASKNQENENGTVYVNNNLGFSIAFPESWEDKYYIDEKDDGIKVAFNTEVGRSRNIYFFYLGIYEGKWEENDSIGIVEKKVGEKNGIIYFIRFPTQAAFEMRDPEEKAEAEVFIEMNKETEDIINSFKLID